MGCKKLLQLYGTLVRSILENGSTVWQTATATDMAPLGKVQRKALLTMCLNMPSTARREALEVATATLPLDLRFAEITVRDMGNIAAKRQEEPLKQLLIH